MVKQTLALCITCLVPFTAVAEMVTYVASGDPNAVGVNDANNGSVDVWDVVLDNVSGATDNGNRGAFYDSNFGWGLYSNSGALSEMRADVDSLLPVSQRDLGLAGDNVMITFDGGSVNTSGGAIGVEFLDASGARQMELVLRGGMANFEISDDLGSFRDSLVGYTTDAFTLGLSINNENGSYDLDIGGSNVSGTFIGGDSTISSIRVFSFNAGSGSDFNFFVDDLKPTAAAIPEPATLATFGIAVGIVFRRRR